MTTTTPIDHALLAVVACGARDTAAADRHLAAARLQSHAAARRDRQVIEIASLVIAGTHERAAGLAFMHAAEFPHDAELLSRIIDSEPAR